MTEETSNIFTIAWDVFYEFLSSGHPSVIHFPIIGILMGFTAGLTALLIVMLSHAFRKKDWYTPSVEQTFDNFVDRFEFTSYVLLILGEAGYIIAAITGFLSAGGVSNAINHELLEFKVRLSIYAFMLILSPIILKTYFGIFYRRNLFNNRSKIIPILYLLPLIPSALITAVVAGAGGRYVYGHSILDTFGLGFLLPGEPPI